MKFIFLTLICFTSGLYTCLAQPTGSYREKEEFADFRKKRKDISGNQINRLKESGALIVLLHSGINKVNAMNRSGKAEMALEFASKQLRENKLIMRAFSEELNFCPVYFAFTSSNDSLLKGLRSGFFLDTLLRADASIQLKENFYLIAVKDMIYNSTLGYTDTEEQAAKQVETGTPIKEAAIVIKDKYLHQLKRPFPYYVEGYHALHYDKYVKELNYKLFEFYGEENVRRIKTEMKLSKQFYRKEKKSAKKERKAAIVLAKQKAKSDKESKNLAQDKANAKESYSAKISKANQKYYTALEANLLKLEEVRKSNKERLKTMK